MVERHEQFRRCLTEKLLAYALGRKLAIGDRSSTDTILGDLQKDETGLHDLLRMIVQSDIFRAN
ncbi:MAG: DUF1585 domain-containing protein [Roseibacillus sp.]|jgi:hypothetical protein